jgi:hypothetical protein
MKALDETQMHSKSLNPFAAHRPSLGLLVLNIFGAVTYVVRSSSSWAIPEEHGMIPVTGEPIVWGLAIIPVCIAFFVLNLAWGSFIVARKQWRSGVLWLLILPIWLVAVAIDFAHH